VKTIDLHIHSTASDGTDSPRAIVEKALEAGLSAIALTDHDTAAGVKEAMAAGRELGLEVIPGIEVSSDYKENNVHILGYFIDPDAPALRPVLDWAARERNERNEKIVGMLAAAGYDISMEALRAEYPGAVLGRPHFCEFLMKKGHIQSVKEGFDTLLGTGRPFYLPKRRIPIAQAVEVIRAAGGIPVLAHPLQYGYRGEALRELVDTVAGAGIRHLEAYYSEHSEEEEREMLALAASVGFGVTGGSDYHGSRKTHISLGRGTGRLSVPYRVLEDLRRCRS